MLGKVLGTIVCGGLALLLDLPVLSLVLVSLSGAVLGHYGFDQRHAPVRAQPTSPSAGALLDALAPLFVEVARADGPVVAEEVRAIRSYFETVLGFSPASEVLRRALKDHLARPSRPVAELAIGARQQLKPVERQPLVQALYELALADGAMKRSEQEAIREAVRALNVAEEVLQSLTGELFGEVPYSALGLTATASDDDIRAAYRRLAAEHHPDRAAPLGTRAVAEATERFRALNEAYEAIRRARGL